MPGHTKDEINFHRFLNATRQLHNVTLDQVCEGLCSRSMMLRIESGDRLPEKQMRDRILSRMGVIIEGYEDYLSIDEYEQWELRQKLLGSIERKEVVKAEQYLEKYRIYEKQNVVEEQYCKAMELMLLQLQNAPLAKQQPVIERAVKLTMSHIGNHLSEKVLLSEQELNLLIEYVRLRPYNGKPEEEFRWRCGQYKDIMNYIEHSRLDSFCRAKVYPKAVSYLCEKILEKSDRVEDWKEGIEACNQAIELLRDSRRLYYFIELVASLEKLVNKYEAYLDEDDKQGERNNFREGLEEKLAWRDVIMELYTEYQVTPYMEHFCHLYWGMESYCIGDIIRTRRQMFGMTKEQLCEGICGIKTLTRLELKQAKTQMPIVRALFKRLGLCAEYIRARVITSDYEVLKLAEECVRYENNYQMEEWIWRLKELEQKLCMDIPQNKQFIKNSYCALRLQLRKISKEQYMKEMLEALEYTIPLEYVMKPGKKFLSREERTYIHNIGINIGAVKDNPYMLVIANICKENDLENDLGGHIRKYEFLLTSIISYLGNIGDYEKSDELSKKLMKKSLQYRREGILAETMYNNLWNYQQRLREGKEIERVYEEKKEIEKYILLSKFGKMDMLLKFFEQKLK